MKRYFIVFYEAVCKQGKVTGNIPMTSESGKYVNVKNVEKLIKGNGEGLTEFKGIIFRNIIELNKSDFKEFIR